MEAAICKILDEAQRDTRAHAALANSLLVAIGTKLKAAIPVLQTCLDCIVVMAKNEPAVKNVMSFLGTLCATASGLQQQQQPESGDEGGEAAPDVTEVHPVALWLMAYAVACTKAENKVVRMRGSEIGAIVMENLPEDANISDVAWTTSVSAVLDRLSDKQSAVRLQAIRFSKRLQSPDDENDPVCARLVEMVREDASVQVRKAAVQAVAVSDATLGAILSRTRDINDSVRVAALGIVRESIPMTVLPIATRTKLLDQALRDTVPAVAAAGMSLCVTRLHVHARGYAGGDCKT